MTKSLNPSLASSPLYSSLVDSLQDQPSHKEMSLSLAMEQFVSAVVSDLLSRALSMVIHRYWQSSGAEEKLQRLQRLVLRVHTIVDEAEGRHITNQAMLQQLQMMREDMYRGYYVLDTFRYGGHEDKADVEEVSGSSFALSRFNPSRRLSFPVCNTRSMDMLYDVRSMKKLDNVVHSLEKMIGDVREFVMFLGSYPRLCQQPYSGYLVLDKVMFARQVEKEKIISFLLQRDAIGSNGNLGVLPIVGMARVGKSTLVEHVCLDERVRDHFSSIVLLSRNDLNGGSGVIKQQNPHPNTHGRSLVVIEVTGDMDEETWRRLYTSGVNRMAHGSKLIITSRSEKIEAFGTTPALKLEPLPQDAFWYFFKSITFGSMNPEDRPQLAAIGMEIAALLKGSFILANIVGNLLRANLKAQFWRKMLSSYKEHIRKHVLLFGEHPVDLIRKDRTAYLWELPAKNNIIAIHDIRHECSPRSDVPMITAQDVIMSGSVRRRGRFEALAWRSSIPPCYTYVMRCESETVERTVLRRKRPRQERI